MQIKKLKRKIRQYIRRYNTATFKSKKILKALKVISENRVILIKTPTLKSEIFLVKGERKIYITIKGLYCTCYGFNSTLLRDKISPCYHLLACEIANKNKLPKLEMDLKTLFNHLFNYSLEKLWS